MNRTTNIKVVKGVVVARSGSSGTDIRYDVVVRDGGVSLTLTGVAPWRAYPPNTAMFAAELGSPARVTVANNRDPIVEVLEKIDAGACGSVS